MKFVDDIRQQIDVQVRQDYEDYRAPVAKAVAAGGKLSAADTGKLAKLTGALGFAPERVEADADVLRKVASLRELAGTAEATAAAYNEANAASEAHEAETAEIFRQRAEQAERLFQEAQSRMAAASRATAAAASLKELESAHWRLLALESPEALANRRHIVQAITLPAVPSGKYDVLALEDVMLRPLEHAGTLSREFVPLEGQAPEEMQRLLTLAREMVAHARAYLDQPRLYRDGGGSLVQSTTTPPPTHGHLGAVYLATNDRREAAVLFRGASNTPEEASEFTHDCCMLLPFPGTKPAEFEAARAEVEKAWRKAKRKEAERVSSVPLPPEETIVVGRVGSPAAAL